MNEPAASLSNTDSGSTDTKTAGLGLGLNAADDNNKTTAVDKTKEDADAVDKKKEASVAMQVRRAPVRVS